MRGHAGMGLGFCRPARLPVLLSLVATLVPACESASLTRDPVAPTGCVSDPRGFPGEGRFFLGAAVSGTSDLATREEQLGQTLPLHRRYYLPDDIPTAAREATRDIRAGRLPWISFKLPYSWADMAAGSGDAWVDQLATALADVPGPVWLAFHHEPEGEGNLTDWVAMQRRLATRVARVADNVAISLIITAWHLVHNAETHTLDQYWPGEGVVDILAFDAYNEWGSVKGNEEVTDWGTLHQYVELVAPFAEEHGVSWAVAETGWNDAAAVRDPHWFSSQVEVVRQAGGIAVAYFDSSFESITDWTLDEPAKLADFAFVLGDSARICRSARRGPSSGRSRP